MKKRSNLELEADGGLLAGSVAAAARRVEGLKQIVDEVVATLLQQIEEILANEWREKQVRWGK